MAALAGMEEEAEAPSAELDAEAAGLDDPDEPPPPLELDDLAVGSDENAELLNGSSMYFEKGGGIPVDPVVTNLSEDLGDMRDLDFKEPLRSNGSNGRLLSLSPSLSGGGGSMQMFDSGGEDAGSCRKRKNRVLLPLEVGTKLTCRWRDDKYHPVTIIERKKVNDEYHYYVHYSEFNRRLDEWVKLDQLNLDATEADAVEKVEDKGLKMTRHQKRKIDETHVEEGHEDFDAASLREHEEITKVKNIGKIELGRYEIDTWYFSPFPPEYSDCNKLFFCEFCLAFVKRKEQLQRHMRKCDLKHPPGDEIYRNGSLSMFEVDGRKNKVYSQNLCYLAKLFLDHKTLYYDVDLFLFYILCECDDRGCHMVGYFSKEKHSEEGYNLACILTLPPYQRKGYGKFLIAFSYELSKKETKVGTPERPLSDLGLLSYRGYWTRVLLDILKKHRGNVSIKELTDMTAIRSEDVINTLQQLELIQYRKGQYVICADPKLLDRHLKAAGRSGLEVDPSKLIWTPYKEQEDGSLMKTYSSKKAAHKASGV
ncbi:putative MYST-like histone acetyltransferase 1 [Selaginella moellendorffii]|uniref:putative MYST-like histone acetyltransferase 1 n=1 Tax=Selaginella moellendorffii TaxID=88036 RepID=UPI000D1C7778|nr:putative MYST-like histone acetyltransferase 1 [Selaginella moellendorffii]XP_024545210.1 putative MYST-like histone acetyltransferase 1 [Selaginella moellendorffii]|eukprot:XP_024545209.1 putative MYST-like histone acetyltransferase 1 [Selaginella moellendorffii]